MIELWFLRHRPECMFSSKMHTAIERMKGDTSMTHVMLKLTNTMYVDVTVDGLFVTDDVDLYDYRDLLVGVVQIEFIDHFASVIFALDAAEELADEGFKIDINQLVRWYHSRRTKHVTLCTDVYLELLDIEEVAPRGALPSELFKWFTLPSTYELLHETCGVKRLAYYNLDENHEYIFPSCSLSEVREC